MKALILNSGMGKRMGDITKVHPKSMTEIGEGETILSRQLRLLEQSGVTEVVMTTGLFDKILVDYCKSLNLSIQLTFVNNPVYDETNYIYSIYLAREHLVDDIVLMHGDLVFDQTVLEGVLEKEDSCMTVSTTLPLPDKDFKAVIKDKVIEKVGIEFFEHAVAAQPLYKLHQKDWQLWLKEISRFCEKGEVNCYAENALNEVSHQCKIYPYDFQEKLCAEIDTPEDLIEITKKVANIK
ncbi:MAG: NTP transferase domain-containing protein [Bacillus sp. (in: Bacteria)]|nr:NTP transferase domain-containing protein [Bacillus sp. (in: firmicutes)]